MKELLLVLQAGAIFLPARAIRVGKHPAAQSFLRDRRGKSFVEVGVAFGKRSLMGQFMKERFGEINVRVIHKRVQDRIMKPADRRISFYAANMHIESLFLELFGISTRGL